MPHILIAGKLHRSGLALLDTTAGVSYDYVIDDHPRAYLAYLPRAEGLILRTQPLTKADIITAPLLKIVSRHGVGTDAIDVSALKARDISLSIVGDVNSRTVAEHTIMLLLAASRRLIKTVYAMRNGDWGWRNEFEPQELDGKTLLIIGYGRIGRQVAQLAIAFGMRINVYDPLIITVDCDHVTVIKDLHKALTTCDCLSLHIPGGQITPLLGETELSLLKPQVVIVNTARGGLIDEVALFNRLRNGHIGAVALDVLSQEPPLHNNPLLNRDDVIVTPHAAGLTAECAARMAVAAVTNILNYFAGNLNPALVVRS